MFSGWLAGTAPEPSRVQLIGILLFSDKLITSFDAPDIKIPCPAKMTGFFASAIILTALSKSMLLRSLFIGFFPGIVTFSSGYINSNSSACRSLGTSMRTGPGLPDRAIAKASLIVFARSLISITR